jgi:hypothetical protein
MYASDVWFWLGWLGLTVPITGILDYAINCMSGRPEFIWQTWWRLRKEHRRLYPKGKHEDD